MFDAENRLVSVTANSETTQFVYNGDGVLVKKVLPGGNYMLYFNGMLELEKSSPTTLLHTTVYYPVGGAMQVDGTLYYVLKDQLGSASVMLDGDGDIVGEMRYYPFGETRMAYGEMITDKLFTGQRLIEDLDIPTIPPSSWRTNPAQD